MTITIHHGDSREVLKGVADCSVDSVITDPPYALVSIGKRFGADNAAPAKAGKTGAYQRASAGFMGKKWDTGETAFDPKFWVEVMRVLKPGGHVIAASGTRTYHRLACAVEDAGFEIRDMISWLYGSGFPKSHDVSKGIDKRAGAEREVVGQKRNNKGESGQQTYAALGEFRQSKFSDVTDPASAAWEGWGTALKPACEPWVLARKPLVGTVAANVLAHGVGALNIDACRVEGVAQPYGNPQVTDGWNLHKRPHEWFPSDQGRWPANVIHDGSDEVVGAFPETSSGLLQTHHKMAESDNGSMSGKNYARSPNQDSFGDRGSAARFFYTAKADAEDRLGSKHPTVKPVDLMRYLCRLVTPPGGVVLDPFAGSGSTGVAAYAEGFDAILIEREAEYVADIQRRIDWVQGNGGLTSQEVSRRKPQDDESSMPLFR